MYREYSEWYTANTRNECTRTEYTGNTENQYTGNTENEYTEKIQRINVRKFME